MSSPSFTSTHPPIGSAMTPEAYGEGKAAALAWARENGFKDDMLVEIALQWGDQDSNAHVNNVVYFRWLETGRLNFMRALTTSLPESVARDLHGSGKGKGVILARITYDYRLPAFYPDYVLIMHRPVQYSSRKMVFETAIYSYAQKTILGKGEAVMVGYDYDAQRSTNFPPEVLQELEQRGARKVERGVGAKL
ncbi:hypothetical protein JCM10207_004976 [Rhodosporidiobolus poonsookiae]